MNCKYCGAELIGNSSFCVKCGKNNDEEIVEVKEDEISKSLGINHARSSSKKIKNSRYCIYCGTELLGNSSFCIKCGKNNDEEIVETKKDDVSEPSGIDLASLSRKKNKSINLKIILIPVALMIFAAIFCVVALVVPCSPKASLESGMYEECQRISFSASKILPFGKEPEIYISVDGGGFQLYDGREYYLNQASVYSYDIYTINGAGIKSSEKHYEYEMNVPKPHELNVSIEPGTYEDYQNVELLTDDGSIIYFTTDGSEPNDSSSIYDSAIHLDNGKTIIKALAINGDGTIGDIYQWEYDLKLPIPSTVSYSAEGGIHYAALDLELSSDADATIYYTMDGSEPTSQSNVYSGPIRLENGIHTIKSMAVNGYNMPSEITEGSYVVTMPKYARLPRSAVADQYYGVIGDEGALVGFDAQLNEVKRYGVTGVTSIYSDGTNIYYLAANSLYKLNAGSDAGNKLIDMFIDNFALVNEVIYIESSGILYTIDLNGGNLSKYEGMNYCNIMGSWKDVLYYTNGDNLSKIASKEGIPEVIAEIGNLHIFVKDNIICYIDGAGELFCKNLEDGTSAKLMEAYRWSDSWNDTVFGIKIKTITQTTTIKCDDLYACNNTLYVRKRTYDEESTINAAGKTTDFKNSESYKWYALDLASGKITDTNIATPSIAVFDNVIVDGDGNRNQVVQ